ncbi:MAG: sigma-54-dependent Fis family transcriptional regulator [Candidatus Hydrogenedentes bacterium]|nr:sigma-54-dependent Fis family transcriptional regulator [Candidatus Hydrogenedentota bacterium]
MHILVIDDDESICRTLQITLREEGHEVTTASNGIDGLAAFEQGRPQIVFVDLQLPDISGLDVLRKLRKFEQVPLMVMITGHQDAKATIEAIRIGAFDYIRKPIDLDAIIFSIEKASQLITRPPLEKVKIFETSEDSGAEIVGAHPKIVNVLKQIGHVSQSRIPVLIEGESGTGKELVSKALHHATSPGKPFVAVNCAAIVPSLLESELFGHVKGAFTGADSERTGRFEAAEDGTIFLDEISEAPPDIQVKLLRVLQENEFEKVGDVRPIPLRARVIAATNKDLRGEVSEKRFREDLYHRLAVSVIHVPPLRERKSDIPLLARHMLATISKSLDRQVNGIETRALDRLQNYDWPGNVRELRNTLTRAVVLSREDVISYDVVLESMDLLASTAGYTRTIGTLREAEKRHIELALEYTKWNKAQTAAILGITRVTLRKKIDDYKLHQS